MGQVQAQREGSQETDAVEPTLAQMSHKSDALRAQFLNVQGQWYVGVCHLACFMIYNANFTRKLFSYEIAQALQNTPKGTLGTESVQNRVWFTCCTKAFDKETEEE